MARKLFVGNLPLDTSVNTLSAAFAPYGASSVTVIAGQGIGYVNVDEALAAIAINEMDGKRLNGERIVVRDTLSREKRFLHEEDELKMYYDPYCDVSSHAYRFS
jgi:RNA recognition motif-containing protein